MSKPVSHSYSALKAWRDCPRLHREKFINRSVKDEGSPAMQRGSRIHKNLELAVRYRSGSVGEITLGPKTQSLLDWLRDMRAKTDRKDPQAPGAVLTERKIAIDRAGGLVDFFDKDAWIRTVVDAMWVSLPNWDRVFAVDWKTGKVRVDPLQADVTGYVLRKAFNTDTCRFAFAYVEHDHIADATPASDPGPTVESLIEQVEADLNHEATPRQCYMCRFCPVKWCEYNAA